MGTNQGNCCKQSRMVNLMIYAYTELVKDGIMEEMLDILEVLEFNYVLEKTRCGESYQNRYNCCASNGCATLGNILALSGN